jgi:hypothetical protein
MAVAGSPALLENVVHGNNGQRCAKGDQSRVCRQLLVGWRAFARI